MMFLQIIFLMLGKIKCYALISIYLCVEKTKLIELVPKVWFCLNFTQIALGKYLGNNVKS